MAYSAGKTKITSHIPEVTEAVRAQLKLAMENVGDQAVFFAQAGCPVKTGNLRNSIKKAVPDYHTVIIGSNVEYAAAVEFREIGHTTGGPHYLKNAITQHKDTYKKVVDAALNALN